MNLKKIEILSVENGVATVKFSGDHVPLFTTMPVNEAEKLILDASR